MEIEAISLSLPIIIGLGAIDAINPCVIGVLLLLLAVLMRANDKGVVLKNGLAYTAGVYFTYLIGGLSLLAIFDAIRNIETISRVFYLVIGVFVLIVGALEIKDFFWYGKWFSLSIPKKFVGTIEERVETTHTSLVAAAFFGFTVTLIELPCTGAPYLAILALMSQSGLAYVKALPLLLLYNLVFVLPLLIIIGMVYYGASLKRFHTWREEKRGLMRLGIGLALWVVGIWIITTLKATWLIPLVLGLVSVIALMAILKYVVGYGREKTIQP
ncbi:GAP family protein [candidate division WWE3 bacterium]|nr:GAP family protein [candidate division WWE3 bacterium]